MSDFTGTASGAIGMWLVACPRCGTYYMSGGTHTCASVLPPAVDLAPIVGHLTEICKTLQRIVELHEKMATIWDKKE